VTGNTSFKRLPGERRLITGKQTYLFGRATTKKYFIKLLAPELFFLILAHPVYKM
jgi:hypothetical protein